MRLGRLAVALACARRLFELSELNRSRLVQNDELQAFSHTLAHELKNPLGVLSRFAEKPDKAYSDGQDGFLAQGIGSHCWLTPPMADSPA
jgi:light-regulated signal transduction histidine kinase (bacteriophytochrome)